MNLRDAAQQALEALVQIHPGNMTPMAEESWNNAITALREALNIQQTHGEECWRWHHECAIRKINERLS